MDINQLKIEKSMKTQIKTKEDFFKWAIEAVNWGNSVPYSIRGGGFGYISDEEELKALRDDEEYLDYIEYVSDDDEDVDFLMKSWLSTDEQEGMKYIRLPHNTGYNQENFDMFFGCYEL